MPEVHHRASPTILPPLRTTREAQGPIVQAEDQSTEQVAPLSEEQEAPATESSTESSGIEGAIVPEQAVDAVKPIGRGEFGNTAFEKKESSALNNTTDTVETSEGKRNDTATSQDTAILADKGTTNSVTAQGNDEKSAREVGELGAKAQPAGKVTEQERMERNERAEEIADNGKQGVDYKLSDEVDENGRQFIFNSEGNIEFGVIDEASGLPSAPIRLSEGKITNPTTNDGYGLVHIEARHGEEIRRAGYKSVVEFVEGVAKNWEHIKEGTIRDGKQTYMLYLTDKHNNTLMIELSGDDSYWNVNTAGIFKTSYGHNRKEVYSRHTTTKQPTEAIEVSQNAEQSGTQANSSINTPTLLGNKGTTNSVTVQEKSGEIPLSEENSEIIDILLKDHTTGKQVIWANGGEDKQEQIQSDRIGGIIPRFKKKKTEQKGRTKSKAEVFTPSWVCNCQNN